jgi:hypothetical protein
MTHRTAVLLALSFLAFAAPFAAAHEDQIGPLVKVEKTYAAPTPLGPIRALYVAATKEAKASLLIKSDAFEVNVPAEGLSDLPRPDWDRFTVAYSLTSYANGRFVERPYVYLSVVLYGPPGQSWEQTWATFHVDADGKLTRKVKRFVDVEKSNSIRVIWRDWPIGGKATAAEILEAAKE